MIALMLQLLLFLAAQGSPSKPANDTRSVWDGVYSEPQSIRGETAYREECARCHSESLGGAEGAPALVGDDFLARWQGASLNELFERIRTTMPADSPGRLGRQQCADILAYILSVNRFPAGKNDLERDSAALERIRIANKP